MKWMTGRAVVRVMYVMIIPASVVAETVFDCAAAVLGEMTEITGATVSFVHDAVVGLAVDCQFCAESLPITHSIFDPSVPMLPVIRVASRFQSRTTRRRRWCR